MDAGFALINLISQETIVFPFFPNEIRSSERANWEPQETTTGVKPLFYANRDPRSMEVQDLYFDNSDSGESLLIEIESLRALLAEDENRGTPPPLLAVWGDREERCVLQELSIEEVLFNAEGLPTRVRVGLSLLQLQPDGDGTSVRVQS